MVSAFAVRFFCIAFDPFLNSIIAGLVEGFGQKLFSRQHRRKRRQVQQRHSIAWASRLSIDLQRLMMLREARVS
jgi:hypothetical protein